MDVIERRISCDFIRSPQILLSTVQTVCRKNGLVMESLAMRNDEYIIRARRSPTASSLCPEIAT